VSTVEGKLFLGNGMPKPLPPRIKLAAGPGYSKDYGDIVKRNVFCATCPPLEGADEPDGGAEPGTGGPVKTTLPYKLLAIMYAPPPNQRWSVAVIRNTDSGGTSGAFGVKDKISDVVEVTEIDEKRVFISNNGRPEYIDLFEDAAPPPAPKTASIAPAAPSGGGLPDEIKKGLKKTGENQYEVQRTTLDSVLGNLSELSRSARIVPEVKDGRPAGFRLYSVRPDGPFALIGLQNGDVISSINGIEMNSPDQALGAYTKLKSASHLTVQLERGGKKTTMEYNIR